MVHNYQKKIDKLLKKARSQDSNNNVKTSIVTGKLSPEKSQQLLEDVWSSNSKVGVGNRYNLVVNSRKRKNTKISKIHKILKPSRTNKKRILFPKGSNTPPKSPEYYSSSSESSSDSSPLKKFNTTPITHYFPQKPVNNNQSHFYQYNNHREPGNNYNYNDNHSDLDVNASIIGNNSISTRALNTRKKLKSREVTPEKISRNQEETPTNANILENYFHSEGKHQKANRSIRTFTEDNIDDASPDTKSILTLAKNCNSDDGFNLLLQNYQMENPFL